MDQETTPTDEQEIEVVADNFDGDDGTTDHSEAVALIAQCLFSFPA